MKTNWISSDIFTYSDLNEITDKIINLYNNIFKKTIILPVKNVSNFLLQFLLLIDLTLCFFCYLTFLIPPNRS